MQKFIQAASQRKELAGVMSTYSANVPQMRIDLDREKALQWIDDLSAMDDDELEAIRRRKLAELQQYQDQAVAQQQMREQVMAQRQTILRQILTPEARERLGRIELAYPELADSIESQLIALAQSGRVQRAIDDATLKQILERVMPKRRDIKIERR